MSIWDWIHEYRWLAEEDEDEERIRLSTFLDEAHPFFSTDPARAITILQEGRQQARAVGEPRWELFYQHWEIQVRLHYLCDYRGLLDLTLHAAVQGSKPQLVDFPQKVCLQEDLIGVYQHIDPLGYDEAIEQAVQCMEQTVTPDMECRYCTLGCRISLERDRQHHREAWDRSLQYLAEADDASSDFSRSSACWYLCQLALRANDRVALQQYAELGEEAARRADRPNHIALFLMFQALALREAGDEKAAERIYRNAYNRQNRLSAPPSREYFEAQARYHEVGGHVEKALLVRERQLRTLSGKGALAEECESHIDRCTILAKLGRLTEADLDQARTAARLLRRPESYLERIEKLKG